MNRVIMIDGGAGRVIAALPAIEKHLKLNPQDDVKIVIFGFDNFVWGNPRLQDITFNADTKGITDQFMLSADQVITPEPYRLPSYFRQEVSLVDAFDEIINNTKDHTDLGKPILFTSISEEKNAANIWADCVAQQKKKKNVIIQPYGRGVRKDRTDIIDDASRSINSSDYLKIAKKLSTKYNLILFAEKDFNQPDDVYTLKPEIDIRSWFALIEAADYFIGCDSVGQHIAYAMGTPGTVILGSTFAVNTTYPEYFQIIEKEGVPKKYSPIRMGGLDSHLADRINDRCMDFTDKEIDAIIEKIIIDVEKKVK